MHVSLNLLSETLPIQIHIPVSLDSEFFGPGLGMKLTTLGLNYEGRQDINSTINDPQDNAVIPEMCEEQALQGASLSSNEMSIGRG